VNCEEEQGRRGTRVRMREREREERKRERMI